MTEIPSHNFSWRNVVTRRSFSLSSKCSFLESCCSVSKSSLVRQSTTRHIRKLLIPANHKSLDFLCELLKALDEVIWFLALLNYMEFRQGTEFGFLYLACLIWEAATSECNLVFTVFNWVKSSRWNLCRWTPYEYYWLEVFGSFIWRYNRKGVE